MDPLTLSSLISLGGGLIKGLISPSPKKQLKWQRESDQQMSDWQAGKIESKLKPALPYYQSGNLPMLGGNAMAAVMGNLAQRLGPEMLAKWGITLPQQPGQLPPSRPATPLLPEPRRPRGFPGQDILMQRYAGRG